MWCTTQIRIGRFSDFSFSHQLSMFCFLPPLNFFHLFVKSVVFATSHLSVFFFSSVLHHWASFRCHLVYFLFHYMTPNPLYFSPSIHCISSQLILHLLWVWSPLPSFSLCICSLVFLFCSVAFLLLTPSSLPYPPLSSSMVSCFHGSSMLMS